ncbi:MAG: tRNA (guanosine(46)-N7)-methyltransferase TrmB [Lachnospiraceae bacterium]|nr:tRNA (guanosine(46)-N7)-methyltransferase TrmB [Lachnospiraceae bacterium]
MRLRNIKGAKEAIALSPYVVQKPEQYRGRWNEFFGNNHPLHIEIGMGKGKFITSLAQKNPGINYIGIELYESVLIRAVTKREAIGECPNLTFLRYGAEHLEGVFAPGEVSRIYLNFSDPWPKERHAKRRLTSKEFLERYLKFLQAGGQIEFKTDNRALFDFSLSQAEETGWNLREISYDLHHSQYMVENVMTEYEERFSALGNPIHRFVAFPPTKQGIPAICSIDATSLAPDISNPVS